MAEPSRTAAQPSSLVVNTTRATAAEHVMRVVCSTYVWCVPGSTDSSIVRRKWGGHENEKSFLFFKSYALWTKRLIGTPCLGQFSFWTGELLAASCMPRPSCDWPSRCRSGLCPAPLRVCSREPRRPPSVTHAVPCGTRSPTWPGASSICQARSLKIRLVRKYKHRLNILGQYKHANSRSLSRASLVLRWSRDAEARERPPPSFRPPLYPPEVASCSPLPTARGRGLPEHAHPSARLFSTDNLNPPYLAPRLPHPRRDERETAWRKTTWRETAGFPLSAPAPRPTARSGAETPQGGGCARSR